MGEQPHFNSLLGDFWTCLLRSQKLPSVAEVILVLWWGSDCSALVKQQHFSFSPVHPGTHNECYKLLSSMPILFLVCSVCLETDNDEKGTNLFS